DRIVPVLLSVKATTEHMMARTPFPTHEDEYRIAGDVAVFTYYRGRGMQFQPFETFKVGMSYVNRIDPEVDKAREVADRMLQLSVRTGSALVWEYYFPFGGPATPWTSSISQALGTEFFTRTAINLPEAERAPYLATSDAMIRSFQRSTRMGGVSVTEGTGRFYVMYPFNPAQRILNGHLQVLENLSRLQALTPSPAAQAVVDAGVAGVLPLLPSFDTGGWSNYQPGQEAELGYHEFQTEQLVRLGKLTGNTTFRDFGDRFQLYLLTPPTVVVPETGWLPIIPAVDGYRDTIVVSYTVNKRSRDELRIYDVDGEHVRTLGTSGGRGTHKVTWDGRTGAGVIVPDGAYTAKLKTTDVVGNFRTGDVVQQLRVERDVVAPTLGSIALTPRGRTTIVKVKAADLGSAWVNARIVLGKTSVVSRRGPRMGTITLVVPRTVAQVRTGVLRLEDSSGNVLEHPID
ncbi:MAG: D-glucuronyl C5-epimerase domain protein, partial [Thermoleophilia bacterium]|nr:D-glucuronyl C5-epimerase domain protein [Thermoleophilia bacterium]